MTLHLRDSFYHLNCHGQDLDDNDDDGHNRWTRKIK